MVGKPNRKKQVLSAHDRSEGDSAVEIRVAALCEGLSQGDVDSVPDLRQWLDDLKAASTCTEQTRIIQQFKKKCRLFLLEESISEDQLKAAVTVLLRLYLLPEYFPLHIVLDWFTVALKDIHAIRAYAVQEVVLPVALELFTQASATIDLAGSDCLAQLLPWQSAFSAVVLIDRDLNFIGTAERTADIANQLDEHLQRLMSIDHLQLAAPELVKWTVCTADTLRNLGNLYKTHLESLKEWAAGSAWADVTQRLRAEARDCLLGDAAAKDCVSAAAALYLLTSYVSEVVAGGEDQAVGHIRAMPLSIAAGGPDVGEVRALPRMSQCALVKESIVIFGSSMWLPLTPDGVGCAGADFLLRVCEDSSSCALQLFALQALEAWMVQLHRLVGQNAGLENSYVLSPSLGRCLGLLCRTWTHPARQVNHVVPDLFARLLEVLKVLIPSWSVGSTGDAALSWPAALQEIMSMPGQHRGKYQALKALMESLGSDIVMASYPNMLSTLLHALRERDVAASVTALLATLFQRLGGEGATVHRVQVVEALTSTDPLLRSHAADYLLPQLLPLETFAPALLLELLEERLQRETADTDPEVRSGTLAAYVAVVLAAKTQGLTVKVPAEFLLQAASCSDDNIRLNALVASAASLRSSRAVEFSEFQVLKEGLSLSLKTTEPDQCMKLQRALRLVLTRCKDSSNPSHSAIRKHKGRKLDAVAPAPAPTPVIEPGVGLEEVLRWVVHEVEAGVYPGVTFDREMACLSVLDICIQTLGAQDAALNKCVLSSPSLVRTLLQAFLSNWDRSRSVASSMLAQLPRPWPGYSVPVDLQLLLVYALDMAQSARLRESDAGAQLVCNIFTAYSLQLGWTVDVAGDVHVSASVSSPVRSGQAFLESLLLRLDHSLSLLSRLFDTLAPGQTPTQAQPVEGLTSTFPLAHGLVLALKHCMTSVAKLQFLKTPDAAAQWRGLFAETRRRALYSLEVAMRVVAEANSDVPFAPAQGAVSNSMAASYVNTNSFAPLEGEEEGSEGVAKAQRGVIAAWLLVKEAAALLAALVDLAPVPVPGGSPGDLLTTPEVQEVGEVLLNALGRLKHMGAIAEAHVALQTITSSLFRMGDQNPALSRLPAQWLQGLLARLQTRSQVFILRRSAGFAYSFLSLLRAEPANGPPVLLYTATSALLKIVEEGFQSEDEDVWKLSVHSLNVLRILFLDSSFGPELDPVVAQVLVQAVRGFQSPHWAIRNSSMMSFAAAVQRCVCKDKNDRATAAAVTAVDFFARHSALLPFLAQTVTAALVNAKRDADTEGVLYPVLLLLAKFRAPLLPLSEPASVDLRPILQALDLCVGHRVHLIRSVTARALTSLHALASLPQLLLVSLTALGEKASGTNEQHGRLLVCLDILEQVHAQRQAALDPQSAVFVEIDAALSSPALLLALRQAMATLLPTHRPVCPPLALVLLQVLNRLAAVGSEEVRDLLARAAHRNLHDLLGLFRGEQSAVRASTLLGTPWAPALARLSVELLFSLPLHAPDELLSLVRQLLACVVTEVRDGVYHGLTARFGGRPELLAAAPLAELLQVLAVQLARERQPASLEALAHLLRVLAISFYGLNADVDGHDVDLVLSAQCAVVLAQDRAVPRNNNAALLEVHSLATRRLSQGVHLEEVGAWFDLVRHAAQEDKPADLRLAAASALQRADLLARTLADRKASPAALGLALDQLLLAFDLLQDDDDDVRERANELLCSLRPATSAPVTTVSATLEFVPSVLADLLDRAPTAVALGKVWARLVPLLGDAREARGALSCLLDKSSKVFEAEQANLFREDVKAGEALCLALLRVRDREAAAVGLLPARDALQAAAKVLRVLADSAVLSPVHALSRVNCPVVFQVLYVGARLALACGGGAALAEAVREVAAAAESVLVSSAAVHLHPSLHSALSALA